MRRLGVARSWPWPWCLARPAGARAADATAAAGRARDAARRADQGGGRALSRRAGSSSRSSISSDDFAEAKAEGKRFAVIFEQRGCPYCTKLHTEVLAQNYINDYVRENFSIVQLDLWGAREVTDFDGKVMSEKALAERWGVIFTPTIVFYKDDLAGLDGKWGRELEAIERLPLSYGRDTFYDLFVWVRHKIYESDRNFQRFHISRIAEREALKTGHHRKAIERSDLSSTSEQSTDETSGFHVVGER